MVSQKIPQKRKMTDDVGEKVTCPNCFRAFAKPAHLKTHQRAGTRCIPRTTKPAAFSSAISSFNMSSDDDEPLSQEQVNQEEEEEDEKQTATVATLNMHPTEFETLNNIVKADLQEDGIDVSMEEEEYDSVVEEEEALMRSNYFITTTAEEEEANTIIKKDASTAKITNDNIFIDESVAQHANNEEKQDNNNDGQHLQHTIEHPLHDEGSGGFLLSPLRRTICISNLAPYSLHTADGGTSRSSEVISASNNDDTGASSQYQDGRSSCKGDTVRVYGSTTHEASGGLPTDDKEESNIDECSGDIHQTAVALASLFEAARTVINQNVMDAITTIEQETSSVSYSTIDEHQITSDVTTSQVTTENEASSSTMKVFESSQYVATVVKEDTKDTEKEVATSTTSTQSVYGSVAEDGNSQATTIQNDSSTSYVDNIFVVRDEDDIGIASTDEAVATFTNHMEQKNVSNHESQGSCTATSH